MDNNSVYLFYAAIFLLRLPPINTLLINVNLLNSHSIARYVLIVLVVYHWIRLRWRPQTADVILLFYFAAQSLSVIGAHSVSAFLLSYKNLVFGLLVYYAAVFLINTKQRLRAAAKLLIATAVVYVAFESAVYFFPHFFYRLRPLFYGSYWENLDLNFQRGRYFVDIFDFALVPLILYAVNLNFRFLPLLFAILYFAAVSGFRSHLLAYGIGFASYFLWFRDRLAKKYLLLISVVLVAAVAYFSFFSAHSSSLTTVTRIIENPEEARMTASGRLQMWGKAFDIGMQNQIFGVGLGNYYLYNLRQSNLIEIGNWNRRFSKITDFNPHNLFFSAFAETGSIGLIALVILIGYWIRIDTRILLRRPDRLMAVCILCFWSLFSYSLLNPAMPAAQYTVLFWLLRGMIYRVGSGEPGIQPRFEDEQRP